MVEMRNQEKNETPEIITVSMILEDLENGEDRNAIREKYGLQAWEVKQMFEHPSLKGKKAKKLEDYLLVLLMILKILILMYFLVKLTQKMLLKKNLKADK